MSFNALVLAGSRGGIDPVADYAGVSDKALIEIGGRTMLARVIGALREAGATVSVCSQALHGQKIAATEVDAAVRQDLSAMTTLAALQAQGYALIPE